MKDLPHQQPTHVTTRLASDKCHQSLAPLLLRPPSSLPFGRNASNSRANSVLVALPPLLPCCCCCCCCCCCAVGPAVAVAQLAGMPDEAPGRQFSLAAKEMSTANGTSHTVVCRAPPQHGRQAGASGRPVVWRWSPHCDDQLQPAGGCSWAAGPSWGRPWPWRPSSLQLEPGVACRYIHCRLPVAT